MTNNDYPFIKNNIHFRMLSSSIIATFKTKQAQDLQQVTRLDVKFAEPCREVLLLEYERVSRLLMALEYVCLKNGSDIVSASVIEDILSRVSRGISTIETVIAEHTDIFADIGDFVQFMHSQAVPYVKDSIQANLKDSSADTAFIAIARVLTDYMEHVLLSLHEYNSICYRSVDTPFICISNFDKANKDVPVNTREQFLKTKFNIPDLEHHDYTTKIPEELKAIFASDNVEECAI